mmetsp:Transcript_20322/g.40663  ORF Transcript_20322/g.40663 Transcript_20322/m.40663 type:complete len:204 (+) Transcript_20322:1225-1836(+)
MMPRSLYLASALANLRFTIWLLSSWLRPATSSLSLVFKAPISSRSFASIILWLVKSTLSTILLTTTGLFLMFLAWLAYTTVLSVSWKSVLSGLTHATIRVLLLPPRLSCRILVSLLSLYGTWALLALPPLSGALSALMTFPKQSRPWLMFMLSLSLSPLAPVLLALSLPARSTRWNLDLTMLLFTTPPTFSTLILSRATVKMA